MGRSPAEIEREIARTRREIELQVVELRRQGRIQAGRILTAAAVAVGVAAAVGAGLVVWRMTRPVTWDERLRRLMPPLVRDRWPAGVKRGKVKGSGEDRIVVVEPDERPWERLLISLARAAAAAAATAAISRIMQSRKQASGEEASA